MISKNYDLSFTRVNVEFTKHGQRSLNRLNSKLGDAAVKVFIMARDLAEYIEHRIEAGDPMISEFTVRYDDGILLTAYLSHGTYYITEVEAIDREPAVCPYYVWERVRVGCRWFLAQVFMGWCKVFSPLKLVCKKCY